MPSLIQFSNFQSERFLLERSGFVLVQIILTAKKCFYFADTININLFCHYLHK